MSTIEAGRARRSDLTAEALEVHRPAIRGYCYRMLGSAADAEDATQETMVRAWRGLDRFEGRAPIEAWLHRIATNVCLNQVRGRGRRALPMDVAGPSSAGSALGRPRPSETWVGPILDELVGDPADVAATADSIRLAFVAALQLLPPRQRAVLILRDVLGWRAHEVAGLLDTSVVSVKSALQRARATLAAEARPSRAPIDGDLLDRYIDAFTRYDLDALVSLIHQDATLSMPPFDLWLEGRAEIAAWFDREGRECAGTVLAPIAVNGGLGLDQRRPCGPGGELEPFATTVLEGDGELITTITAFLAPEAVARISSGTGSLRRSAGS